MLHYKCNIKHITHNNKEYEVCIYYNPPRIKFVILTNKMNHNRSTALERSVKNYWCGGGGGGLIKFVSKIINEKGNIFIIYVIFSMIVLNYQQTAFN